MQPGNSSQLRDLVQQDVPQQFLVDVIIFLRSTYSSVHNYVYSEFNVAVAKDLLPYFRRARIEDGIKPIAERYDRIKVKTERNDANNCSHNVITCDRIVLTLSLVNSPNELIRSANFRHTLAKSSQLELFDDDNKCSGDFYYGIILHGAPEPDTKFPSFVRLVFPSKSCTRYVESIDLLKFCNFDASKYSSGLEEVIDDMILKPEFRTDLQKQKEA